MTRPIPRAGIRDIAAYVAGEKNLPGFDEPIVLASNESPLGPSPLAVAAARETLARMHIYPDPGTRRLNEALAACHGIDPDWIICGAGSENLIEVICRVYAGPGDEVLAPAYSFPMYSIFARAAGATPVTAPVHDFTTDVDALLGAITPRTRIVFIANPNNPTGTWIGRDALARLAAGVPDDVLLVIDSAYAGYATDPAYDDGLGWVRERRGRVLCVQTFSKLQALAGLRVGWAHADPETIADLMRARAVFAVSRPAEAAAVAALGDQEHTRASIAHNERWRPWLAGRLAAAGLQPLPSGGNFILARHPRWDRVDAVLRGHGIIVRAIPPVEGLRITVGTEAQMLALERALEQWRATDG
ncbi:MAG: histidinol-phosphate transaminase [Gammaproteobacteria bacterium]